MCEIGIEIGEPKHQGRSVAVKLELLQDRAQVTILAARPPLASDTASTIAPSVSRPKSTTVIARRSGRLVRDR